MKSPRSQRYHIEINEIAQKPAISPIQTGNITEVKISTGIHATIQKLTETQRNQWHQQEFNGIMEKSMKSTRSQRTHSEIDEIIKKQTTSTRNQ